MIVIQLQIVSGMELTVHTLLAEVFVQVEQILLCVIWNLNVFGIIVLQNVLKAVYLLLQHNVQNNVVVIIFQTLIVTIYMDASGILDKIYVDTIYVMKRVETVLYVKILIAVFIIILNVSLHALLLPVVWGILLICVKQILNVTGMEIAILV